MTRSRGILTLVAVGALTLTSAAPPRHLPFCTHGPFEGITQTTSDGTIVGEPDTRDWGCVAERGPGTGRSAPARVRVAPVDPGTEAGPAPPPPTVLCMDPAAPNPPDQATRIQFALPASAHVNLSVYGRQQRHGPRETLVVRALLDATLAAGRFALYWDLTDDQGESLAPGLYRVVLVVGDEALCGDLEVR